MTNLAQYALGGGTAQRVTISASTGTFTLAGSAALAVGCTDVQMQAALVAVFGAGNVLVFVLGGSVAHPRPSPTINVTFGIIFVGALWATYVPPMAVVNSTNGTVTITPRKLTNRIIRLMQHTCDIYKPVRTRRMFTSDPEAADVQEATAPTYIGVPCYYEPTGNFGDPKKPGIAKLANIMTADTWHFPAEVDIADRYMIVMRSTAHPLVNHPWTVQGNPMVNDSLPGRPAESQNCFAVLDPVEMIPNARV